METLYCWPYEELKVTKLEGSRAFRFETPWYASIVQTTPEGAQIFEKAFSESSQSELPPSELLNTYALTLAPIVHEPFSYILAMNQQGLSCEPALATQLPVDLFSSPTALARHFGIPTEYLPGEWTWDVDGILEMATVPGTDVCSPLTLYSIFRRFFFLEAQNKDRTRSLYSELPQACGSREKIKSALAYIITQNLHVTQRCGEVLSAAYALAGRNEDKLRDFIQAEHGHDRIMQKAIEAFPAESLESWTKEFHSCTRALMDTFHRIAQNDFLAFAFSIHLFERPHFEETHPVTRLLRENDLVQAADRYERHHTINEAGEHDQIGFDMIKAMPLLSRAAAEQSVRWVEAMSWVMTSHSACLLREIEKRCRS